MNLALEILFAVLVIADTLLTYLVLESGKGRETAFARRYIKYPAATIVITLLGVAVILVLVNLSGAFILLWPVNAVFSWACWHNWRVLHG
jgi:fatty acid desaturase